jgi:DNA processing protein
MDTERLARISLSLSVEPGDAAVAAALRSGSAADLIPHAGWLQRASRSAQRWRADGIEILIPGDTGWPRQLDDLPLPPLVLYSRGLPLRPLLLPSVTMVGSRAASADGVRAARRWSRDLACAGYTVVSGGAFGIDAAAHEGALSAGRTVAVLASGVDVPSPAAHADLLSRIARSGALVSELPPGTRPARHRFLARNRLIAALTPGTVVVQAAPRSGALATARRAADLHRVVMAVPGSVDDPAHGGCHRLIRDAVAVLVRGPGDIAALLEPIGSHARALLPPSGDGQENGPVVQDEQ